MEEPLTKRRLKCEQCHATTWHMLQAEHIRRLDGEEHPELNIDLTEDDEDFLQWLERVDQIWECLGCEDVVFLQAYRGSHEGVIFDMWEDTYPEHGPSRNKKQYLRIPRKIDALYEEVIAAFNADCLLLCAAGLRSLLEAICEDKGISNGAKPSMHLQTKIDGLKEFVPPNVVDNLHGFRFLGNEALHRLTRPRQKTIALAIEVIEDVLNLNYDLKYKTDRLRKLTTRKRLSGR